MKKSRKEIIHRWDVHATWDGPDLKAYISASALNITNMYKSSLGYMKASFSSKAGRRRN
jgi:hypothetical protein